MRACSDNPRLSGLTSSVFDVYISFPQLFVLWNAKKTIKLIILLFPLFHFLTKNFIRSSPFLLFCFPRLDKQQEIVAAN